MNGTNFSPMRQRIAELTVLAAQKQRLRKAVFSKPSDPSVKRTVFSTAS